MITFDQARQIVAAKLSADFPPEAGFRVKRYGLENATEYQLIWSVSDEFLRPNNGPYPIVNKLTGEYRQEDGPPYRIDDAVEVGVWPVFDPGVDEPVNPGEVPDLEDIENA